MPPGASEADIAREAGVPPWKVKVLRRQWSRWSGDQRRLAAAAVALAEADAAMKGGVGQGTSLDAEQKLLALEILVTGTVAAHDVGSRA
jgi:DNA polymerase-3 subunit delta